MLSIFINLIFVSGFCFLIIIVLEYAIYMWENQKMNDLTKDISSNLSQHDSVIKRGYDANDHNANIFNSSNMKFNLSNKYFERSLVLVTSQDYKGWYEKVSEFAKKILSNLGYYTQKSFKYVIELSKSGNNFPDQEIRHIKSMQSASNINKTVEKITQITEKESTEESHSQVNTKPDFLNNYESDLDQSTIPNLNNDKIDLNQIKTEPTSGATLNLAINDNQVKDTTTYDKIEKSILAKLQETGLNHYDIWLELGHFYQKYEEKEKAKEIFAMVMKHAEGRDKDLARDGLIALS